MDASCGTCPSGWRELNRRRRIERAPYFGRMRGCLRTRVRSASDSARSPCAFSKGPDHAVPLCGKSCQLSGKCNRHLSAEHCVYLTGCSNSNGRAARSCCVECGRPKKQTESMDWSAKEQRYLCWLRRSRVGRRLLRKHQRGTVQCRQSDRGTGREGFS